MRRSPSPTASAASNRARLRREIRRAIQLLAREVGRPAVFTARHDSLSLPRSLHWIRSPEIVGIGLSERVAKGMPTGELALSVYVRRKKPRSRVQVPVPRTLRLPGRDVRMRVDVVEVGEVELTRAQGTPIIMSPPRPLAGGMGIRRTGGEPGTLGCVFSMEGHWFLLSNAHVIAGPAPVHGAPVLTVLPSSDGSSRLVGTLHSWTDLAPGDLLRADAAVAELARGISASRGVLGIGVPKGFTERIAMREPVQKSGYRTHVTHSVVHDVDAVLTLDYLGPDGGSIRVTFEKLVRCASFSTDGDSGAVVINGRNEIVGLILASSSNVTYFCRIRYVFEALFGTPPPS